MVAYYAIVGLKNGATWFDVFTPAQIKALRGQVRKGSIADPEHWMERKTALKQVLKLAPKATSLGQVQALDEELDAHGFTLKAVVSLTADEDAIVDRMLKRAEIEGRPDDNEETIRHRMEVYHEQTDPLLDVYRTRGLLIEVDGMGTVDEVSQRVLGALAERLGR